MSTMLSRPQQLRPHGQSVLKIMRKGTSRDHLLEQLVQQDETMEQKRWQRSQIPMGQGALMEMQQQMQMKQVGKPPVKEQFDEDEHPRDEDGKFGHTK